MTSARRRCQRTAASYNAKARRLGRPGVITGEMLAALPGQCAYCGVELGIMDGTWDHVIPFDRGGTNVIENIVRCCTSCQRRKFTKTPAEYEEHQQLYVTCALPGCEKQYRPRYAEWQNGRARYCSLSHAAASRWVK